MTIYSRPITFTPAVAQPQTRYLPPNATLRQVRPPAAPAPTATTATQPGGLSGSGGELTDEMIAARAQAAVNRYPSAPFQNYTVQGGMWYGVSTVGGSTMYTRLNPATADTSPNPNYRYMNQGTGPATFSEGSAGNKVIAGSARPEAPGPGATKAQISAYSESLASWEREQMWKSIPDSATWTDISDWYGEARFDLPTQERRQWEIGQSLLPALPSQKFIQTEQQYAQQRQVIVSSSGNLVPVNERYTYVDGSGLYLAQGERAADYRNVSTGALFSAPAVLNLGGKAAEVAGIGAARLGQSVLDRGLIGGIAYAYFGRDYLSGGGILPAAIQKPVGPPGSGIDFSPAVQGATDFFKTTPLLSQAYGAGSMIREEGGVLEAYEKWNKETAAPFVQQYVPMPTDKTIEDTKKTMSFLLPLIFPALAPAQYASQAISGISQTFTGAKTPLVSDLLTEHAVGEIEGIRTRPVEAAGMFALTFALPAISEAGAWGWKASPTLMRLSQGKYTKYVFGKIPVRSVPETVHGLKLQSLTGATRIGGAPVFNAPSIAIESVMGIAWGQSVIERITAGPDQTITTQTTTPGSTTARSWIEGGGVHTETTTVGPTVTKTTEVVPGEAAIPARLTFDGTRLVWGADISKLPPAEKMARTAGEITSVEVLPAIGGMIAGQKVIPKVSGWLRSGDTPIDIPTIGYPAAEGYAISGEITGESLRYSFEKNTFAPYPERMQSGFTKEVTHVPRSARLPTEPPGLRGGWSGMEQDIGKVGSTFTLQRNPSEMAGLYMAPGAEFHFTKVEGQGLADIQLIAGLPTVPQPTMLRTTGITDFVEVPHSVRARTLNLIKSWRRAHPGQKMPLSAKQEAYKVVNFWAQENVEPGQAVLPLLKAEYEAVVPTFTKGGQTQLKVTGRKYYVTDEGVRVPIVEAMITEPHKDFAVLPEGFEVGPTGVPVKSVPKPQTRIQRIKDFIAGPTEPPGIEPGGIPITDVHTGKIIERQVGPIGEARRITAEEVPRTFRQLGGPEGKGPGVDGILARMKAEDRAATEQLFKVAKGVEGMKAPTEGALDISKVQSIDAKDAAAIENLLAKYGAEVYGSTIRLGQMEHGRIMQKYGKLPGDLEVKVKDFVGLSRDVAKAIGGTTKKNPFGISVYKGGKDVMSANALRGTMPENPFGWNPVEYVQVKSGAGQYAYERLNQQVIRYAYGSLAGREVRGQWKWGPKPHRTEKDIVGFYSDVQYLLESQPSKGGQVEQVAAAMREIRKHPQVSEVLKGRKFQYGPGSKDYFAGIPLDRYIHDVRTGKRGLITEVGIGASALNLLNAPSTRTTTTGGEVSVATTAPRAYVSVVPSRAVSYVSLGGAGLRMMTSTRRQTETTPMPSYSRSISEMSGITGGVSVFSGTSYGSSISKLISGRSGITGFTGGSLASGRSGITGITGGSGRSGVSGRSGISGVSGRSGISGRSGVSGYSGYYSGYYGGYTPGSPPPNVPPRVPPSTTPMLLTWTRRRWRFILEEKQKKKLRLHFDVRGSKWIIKNPIPRPEVVLGGEPGKQFKNELKIYGKQYSKKTYTVHAPFDVITDYKVTKGLRF